MRIVKIISMQRIVTTSASNLNWRSRKYINPPAMHASAYISFLNSNGILFSSTSLTTPPKQAVIVPSVIQTPILKFFSIPSLIPTIVKRPSPSASNRNNVVVRCFRYRPKNIVTTAEEKITIVAVEFVNQLTGRLPIIISLSVPPLLR